MENSEKAAREAVENLKAGAFTKVVLEATTAPSGATAAAKREHSFRKVTEGVVTTGVDFANLAKVQEGIANGERGEVQPLPWGEWVEFPYIITHKGNYYLRLTLRSPMRVTTREVDGEAVTREEWNAYLTPSALAKAEDGEAPLVITPKMETITLLG